LAMTASCSATCPLVLFRFAASLSTRRLAHRLDLELLQVALTIDFAKGGGGLKLGELCNVIIGAQRRQEIAGGDVVSRMEMQLLDDPGHLECEVGSVTSKGLVKV
jgi:hypothetical protein